MRIDVHAHYWTEDHLDLLADLDARLRLMDRAGFQMQVLSAIEAVLRPGHRD